MPEVGLLIATQRNFTQEDEERAAKVVALTGAVLASNRRSTRYLVATEVAGDFMILLAQAVSIFVRSDEASNDKTAATLIVVSRALVALSRIEIMFIRLSLAQ